MLSTLGCGTEPPAEHLAPNIVTEVDTVVDTDTVIAGEPFGVDCEYLRPDGSPVDFSSKPRPRSRIQMHPEDVLEHQGEEFVAHQTGIVELSCRSLEYGVIDDRPPEVRIEPASAHITTAALDDHQVRAGDAVGANCRAFDVFGNELRDPDFELVADIETADLGVDPQHPVMNPTSTGVFTVFCDVDGADERVGDTLEVLPARPAELYVDIVPDQTTHAVGQVVTVGTVVEDRFGNTVDAPQLRFDAPPTADPFGGGRFRFTEEGTHTVAVEVTEPTHQDEPLVEEIELHINSTGPDINCLLPGDGEMVEHGGGSLEFDALVTDEHGVDEARVDGEAVALDDQGRFSTTVEPRHGINFVEITAVDEYGEENVRTCAFLAAEQWASEDELNDDVVTLQLRQDAIDDSDYQGPEDISSLNDLIVTVLNSDGLRQEVQQQIKADNPYDAGHCDFDVYVEAIYFDGAPHTTSFDLVDGGIELEARFNDIYFDLEITDGAIYCPGTYNPTVVLEHLEVEAYAQLMLWNDLPFLQLGSIDRVESGEVDAEGGNWLSDRVYSAVTSLFQGTFRDVVEDTFEDALSENFDDLFEGLMESLDVDTISHQFDVPSLEGDEPMALDFEFGFSHVGADSQRALFALSAAITPADGADHGLPSLGVAHPEGDRLDDFWVPTASGSVHIALLNQALHALWRGGLFHAGVDSASVQQLPEDLSVQLQASLPPVATLGDDDGVQLMIGAVNLTVDHDEFFDEPIGVDLGATLSTDVEIDNQQVDFRDVTLDELHLSTRDASLDQATHTILEIFLGDMVQAIIDQTVNAALPAMPIPTFTIPYSMWNYDLPVGEDIGLLDSSTAHTETHFRLESGFGIQ